jgi:hypothetical protein
VSFVPFVVIFSLADTRRWVAGSSPAMVKFGDSTQSEIRLGNIEANHDAQKGEA